MFDKTVVAAKAGKTNISNVYCTKVLAEILLLATRAKQWKTNMTIAPVDKIA